MMVHIPEVLDQDQLALCRAAMQAAAWVDGRATAGHQSAQVKNNLQLPEGGAEHRDLGNMVIRALQRSPLFISAVLPHTIFPPLFNRYDEGMAFGAHVDNAVRQTMDGSIRIRTDVSATLFLSGPEEYDGGELTVEDTYGSHSVKLPAGDLVVYPSDSLHYVAPVTRGARLASFFWVQSLVRDRARRALLFDLDAAIIRLTRDGPGHPTLVSLTSIYHNLLRQWVEA
ncbi:Fe2+-dependent dioxygenase [Methylocapsa acidiphila]|uniref:Fe2+-dependent dioxygenase n=1 Tax=Methylocapsa acidiphila TaxID=133552 RepID=UPI0003FDCC16|nr:Fe2+-dependent dioxygenase [Methylocapsa acidiphila]